MHRVGCDNVVGRDTSTGNGDRGRGGGGVGVGDSSSRCVHDGAGEVRLVSRDVLGGGSDGGISAYGNISSGGSCMGSASGGVLDQGSCECSIAQTTSLPQLVLFNSVMQPWGLPLRPAEGWRTLYDGAVEVQSQRSWSRGCTHEGRTRTTSGFYQPCCWTHRCARKSTNLQGANETVQPALLTAEKWPVHIHTPYSISNIV